LPFELNITDIIGRCGQVSEGALPRSISGQRMASLGNPKESVDSDRRTSLPLATA